METSYFIILLAGFGGGIIRGLVGFIKHQYAYKETKFNVGYFLFMMVLSGLVGLATTWAVKETAGSLLDLGYLTPALALIIGYAGGDFIENVYKIIIKKPSLFTTESNS